MAGPTRLELATSGLTGRFRAVFQNHATYYNSIQKRMDAAFQPFGYDAIDSHEWDRFTPILTHPDTGRENTFKARVQNIFI